MVGDGEQEVSLKPNLALPKHFARLYKNPTLAGAIAGAPVFTGNWWPFAVLLLFLLWPLAFVLPAFFPFGKWSSGPGGMRMVASPQGFLLHWYKKVLKITPWQDIQKISIECPKEGYLGPYHLVFQEASGHVSRRVFLVEQTHREPRVTKETYSSYTAFLDAIEANHGAIEGRDRFESRFSRGLNAPNFAKENQPVTAPVRFFRALEDTYWQEGFSLGGLCLVVGGILSNSLFAVQLGLPMFLSAVILAKGLAWLNINLSKKKIVVEGNMVRLERPGKVLRELQVDQISKIEFNYRVAGWWDKSYVEILIDSPRLPSIYVTVNEQDVTEELLEALESLAGQSSGKPDSALSVRYGLHMSVELPKESDAAV